MNLTKKHFKRQYSEYRRNLSNSYHQGKEAFMICLNSNDVFREISVKKDKPVSISVYLYKMNLLDKKKLKNE
jgi:hypothetical protein